MTTSRTKFKTVDEYLSAFPKNIREIIEELRDTIKQAAPQAEELISYNIPAFRLNGMNLVYYAAYKKHVSIYPAPRGNEAFKKILSVYKGGKGTVQFPLDKPIPFDLITKIVKFKVKENLEKAKAKKK